MNQNSNEALKDVRVRQAIVHAINNEGIVKKIMKGFATAAGQQSPTGYAGHDDSSSTSLRPEKSKRANEGSGLRRWLYANYDAAPNNRYVNDAKVAQASAAMLSKIGIKVDLKTMPKAQYWPEFDLCSADMMMIGWHSDTEDSANFSEFSNDDS